MQHLKVPKAAEANLSCALPLMILAFNYAYFGTLTGEQSTPDRVAGAVSRGALYFPVVFRPGAHGAAAQRC